MSAHIVEMEYPERWVRQGIGARHSQCIRKTQAVHMSACRVHRKYALDSR